MSNIKRVLILDTETTGLDPAKDQVIEVGCILFSVEHATPLVHYSALFPLSPTQENGAEAVNRIPSAALRLLPYRHEPWTNVMEMAIQADVFIAHNAEFDRSFVPDGLRAMRPWVCSKNDLTWPRQTGAGMSLVALALAHDLGVACAHRALTDCDLISRLLMRARELGVDLAEMLQRGLRPKAEVIALVSFDERNLAKQAGFQWDAGRKMWSRRMAIDDVLALPFSTRIVLEETR